MNFTSKTHTNSRTCPPLPLISHQTNAPPHWTNHQTHAKKVTKPTTTIIDQTRKRKMNFAIINGRGQRPRLSYTVAETEAKIELHYGWDSGRDRASFSLNHRRPPSSKSAPNRWHHLILSPLSLSLSLNSNHGLKWSNNNNKKIFWWFLK